MDLCLLGTDEKLGRGRQVWNSAYVGSVGGAIQYREEVSENELVVIR